MTENTAETAPAGTEAHLRGLVVTMRAKVRRHLAVSRQFEPTREARQERFSAFREALECRRTANWCKREADTLAAFMAQREGNK